MCASDLPAIAVSMRPTTASTLPQQGEPHFEGACQPKCPLLWEWLKKKNDFHSQWVFSTMVEKWI